MLLIFWPSICLSARLFSSSKEGWYPRIRGNSNFSCARLVTSTTGSTVTQLMVSILALALIFLHTKSYFLQKRMMLISDVSAFIFIFTTDANKIFSINKIHRAFFKQYFKRG